MCLNSQSHGGFVDAAVELCSSDGFAQESGMHKGIIKDSGHGVGMTVCA